MGYLILCIIAVVIIGIIVAFVSPSKEQLKEEAERKKKLEYERQQEREKKEAAWNNVLLEREKKMGTLTKSISINYDKEKSIYVYADTSVIFINGSQHSFDDILSCRIETKTTKGKETHITTPDKFQMAEEQLLWGMGKKYNVKSTTQVVKEPDKIDYTIYIGINSITNPQIILSLGRNATTTNEVNSLMNVIIRSNARNN